MPTPTQKPTTTTEVKREHIVTRTKPDWIDSITLATPILTFLAGYFLNKVVEDYKENQRLNQIEKYYFSLLNTLVSTIYHQAQEIDETAKGLAALMKNAHLVPTLPSLETSRITALPDIDLYKAFILRKKDVDENNKRLTIIAGCINFITGTTSKIEEINKEFVDKRLEFSENFISQFQSLIKIKNAFLLKIETTGNEPPPEVDFVLERFDSHLKYHEKHADKGILGEPVELYKNIIEPLFDDIKVNTPTSETAEFVSLVDTCNVDSLRFFSFRKGHIQRLRGLADSLRTVSKAIEDSVRELQGR